MRRNRLLAVVAATALGGVALTGPAVAKEALSARGGTAQVAATPTAEATAKPKAEPTACWFPMPTGTVEGKDIRCAYVQVPLRYDRPKSPMIKLAVATLTANGPAKERVGRRSAVVLLSGGPSQSGVNLVRQFVEAIPEGLLAARRSRDIVFVDQRGTGWGEPQLTCPEIGLDVDVSEQLKQCYDRLSKTIDLSQFNTTNNARDFDVVRTALGYRQWDLYGVSYGSRLGYNILRQAPAGTIRSALLSSPIPHRPNWITHSPQGLQSALDALYRGCAADAPCRTRYGNLRTKTDDAFQALQKEPLVVTLPQGEAAIDGSLMSLILSGSLYSKGQTQRLPEFIDALYDRDTARVLAFLAGPGMAAQLAFAVPGLRPASGAAAATAPQRDPESNDGMYFSVLCGEDLQYGTVADLEASAAKVSPLAAGVVPARKLLLSSCKVWPVPKADPSYLRPVQSAVPTLVVAGGHDPATPPSWGRIMAGTLQNAQLVTIRSVGHSPLEAAGACASTLVSTFFKTVGRVDGSCANAPMTFVIPPAGAKGSGAGAPADVVTADPTIRLQWLLTRRR